MNENQFIMVSPWLGGIWAALLIIAWSQMSSCTSMQQIERHLKEIAENTNVSSNAR